jgi:hypothetical protein
VPQSTREPSVTGAPSEEVSGEERMRRGYARSEARNQEIRAGLAPIVPGERPAPFAVAAALLAVLALANLVLLAAGWEVSGEGSSTAYVVGFSAVTLVAAVGVWRMAYLAVLATQALLGISIAIAGLGLLVASNVQAALVSLAVICGAGTLFWKLIRPMARLQIPADEPSADTAPTAP